MTSQSEKVPTGSSFRTMRCYRWPVWNAWFTTSLAYEV